MPRRMKKPNRHFKKIPDLIEGIQQQHPDKTLRVYFQDESRFGQQGRLTRVWAEKGTRPQVIKQCRYQNVYVVGAVCPETGHAEGLISTHLNTDVINAFLEEFSETLAENVQAVMIWDGAGYHSASSRLKVPANISLIDLPAYSPELNPVERLWLYLKDHYWSNRIYADLDDLFDAAMEAWVQVCLNSELVQSICACRDLERDDNS